LSFCRLDARYVASGADREGRNGPSPLQRRVRPAVGFRLLSAACADPRSALRYRPRAAGERARPQHRCAGEPAAPQDRGRCRRSATDQDRTWWRLPFHPDRDQRYDVGRGLLMMGWPKLLPLRLAPGIALTIVLALLAVQVATGLLLYALSPSEI